MVSRRSPRPIEALRNLSDEELLTYINEWDMEHRDEDDWLVEITIEALAETFQSIFRDSILPDANRFRFWGRNRERVERPIYVRAMIGGMQEYIKCGNLTDWTSRCHFANGCLHTRTEHLRPVTDTAINPGSIRTGAVRAAP